MSTAYQYIDDGTGNPIPDMVLKLPDYVFVPKDPHNRDWIAYQQWLDNGNTTYPIGYCYQSTNTTQPPDRNDPVMEFPDFLVIASTDEDLTLWDAYQAWWDQGWRPISYP